MGGIEIFLWFRRLGPWVSRQDSPPLEQGLPSPYKQQSDVAAFSLSPYTEIPSNGSPARRPRDAHENRRGGASLAAGPISCVISLAARLRWRRVLYTPLGTFISVELSRVDQHARPRLAKPYRIGDVADLT